MWNSRLMALHIVADSAIALACYFIAGGIIRLTHRRIFGNVIGHATAWGAAALFVGCGSIQLFDIVTLWRSWYWVDAWLKIVTATVAAATALLFGPVARYYLRGTDEMS